MDMAVSKIKLTTVYSLKKKEEAEEKETSRMVIFLS